MMKYKDPTLDIQVRIDDLLSQMTILEKINQLGCVTLNSDRTMDCNGIPLEGIGTVSAMLSTKNVVEIADRLEKIQKHIATNTHLGIPALIHCEAVNGAVFTEATAFPTAIGQSSTWHPEIIHEMADCVKNQMVAVGYRHALSPVFDIARDPRWGRLTETYGEDETLASAMAVAFVSGLQGNDNKTSVAATGKHFVGHGFTEGGLNMSQNLITERELREVHCKPFQAAISEAHLLGVMNSYCAINREPIISSKRILTGILRDELGFQGILVSDYLSINRLVNPYQTAADPMDAGIQALKAGLDVEYPVPFGFTQALQIAVEDGRIRVEDIDRSVQRILEVKFRLGMFEDPYPSRQSIGQVFHNEANQKLALQIAQEQITLLKNENDLLPLKKDIKKIAVIGPHADNIRSLFGSYSYPGMLDMNEDMRNNEVKSLYEDEKNIPEFPGSGASLVQRFPGDIRETPLYIEKQIRNEYSQSRTLFQAIQEYLPNTVVTAVMGISYTGNNISSFDQAIHAAADADVVILTLGGRNGWGLVATNGEGIDNSNIDLPGKQEEFARAIRALNKRTVVIHFDGKPLANRFVASHYDAIIEAWQPGEMGAQALVSVLFGDYNPAGRLPVTAARSAAQLPAYYGMPRGSGYVSAGRFGILSNRFGYVNDTAQPLYYFGYGLSYTAFAYSNLALSSKIVSPDDELIVSIDLKNIGERDGDEVVQLYASDVLSSMVRPDQQLIGFKRVHIKSGDCRTVTFSFNMSLLAFLDIDMKWKIEAGEIKLKVGTSCVDSRAEDFFYITADKYVDPKTRQFYAHTAVS